MAWTCNTRWSPAGTVPYSWHRPWRRPSSWCWSLLRYCGWAWPFYSRLVRINWCKTPTILTYTSRRTPRRTARNCGDDPRPRSLMHMRHSSSLHILLIHLLTILIAWGAAASDEPRGLEIVIIMSLSRFSIVCFVLSIPPDIAWTLHWAATLHEENKELRYAVQVYICTYIFWDTL